MYIVKLLLLVGVTKTIATLCTPLKYLKINVQEIEILIAIALSMVRTLKKEYNEIKEACKAKNITLNISNIKIILSKLFFSFFKRISQIDEALLEKGYDL